jgi:hypothetical protein
MTVLFANHAEPQRVASYEQYLREAMRRAEYENDLWEAPDG